MQAALMLSAAPEYAGNSLRSVLVQARRHAVRAAIPVAEQTAEIVRSICPSVRARGHVPGALQHVSGGYPVAEQKAVQEYSLSTASVRARGHGVAGCRRL